VLNHFLFRFVDRLGESITSKLEVSNKLQIGRTELQRKKDELEASIKANANNMEKLKKRVVTLKSNIEQSISKLFNGRPVNIIGDLNKF
jgi:chaperonin cofactor prefoldin